MNKKRKRQILTGRVISGEISKTVKVRVTREIPHPVYKKRVLIKIDIIYFFFYNNPEWKDRCVG